MIRWVKEWGAALLNPGSCIGEADGPNSRDKQREVIKYNHLVNCPTYHNVRPLTQVLRDLDHQGTPVPEDALAAISGPYLTESINRFGDYSLNTDRTPPRPDYGHTFRGIDRDLAHFLANRCHDSNGVDCNPSVSGGRRY